MENLVSVVMPVYNRETTIIDAMESIIFQSYTNIEIIVVDDGSTDRTLQILKQYKDNRVKLISLIHTGNIAYVRNIGLEHAKGEYIVIMDSDDICYCDRIEKQLKVMNRNPDIDILATWVEFIEEISSDRKETLSNIYNNHYNKKKLIEIMLNEYCCICNSTVMMKRKAVDLLNGYDEEFSICEDYNMWVEAESIGLNIYVLPIVTLKRRLHCNSVTHIYNGNKNVIYNVIKIKLKYLLKSGLLQSKSIVVLGHNNRNNIIKQVIEYNKFDVVIEEYINDFDKISNSDKTKYYFVTTFSRRKEAFEALECKGKKIVDDYIYV